MLESKNSPFRNKYVGLPLILYMVGLAKMSDAGAYLHFAVETTLAAYLNPESSCIAEEDILWTLQSHKSLRFWHHGRQICLSRPALTNYLVHLARKSVRKPPKPTTYPSMILADNDKDRSSTRTLSGGTEALVSQVRMHTRSSQAYESRASTNIQSCLIESGVKVSSELDIHLGLPNGDNTNICTDDFLSHPLSVQVADRPGSDQSGCFVAVIPLEIDVSCLKWTPPIRTHSPQALKR
ncbi:unnamed protein product [Protopolystoma xenopodis]|uniref:Uncharacterized protein n=1 Tax=Protopolystoma xenopodis TaxID=117903 RepID=A0A448WMC9_9PLAT|nr:unnamed protein product [Protopolystoma xenopodis]